LDNKVERPVFEDRRSAFFKVFRVNGIITPRF
jgi:hypothetical protein